jgi:pimeloyl-ACP methyl ester carboxylesterase
MLKEQSFNVGAISINFGEGPASGPPLVFLHGISGWWQSWIPVMPALSLRWQIFALDFRGHGKSGRTTDNYHWDNYVQDTISFLRERVGEPAVIVGHSMGAMVTLKIAAQAPEAVRAIVLEDPPLFLHRDYQPGDNPLHDIFIAWRDLGQTEYSLEKWLPALAEISPEDSDLELRKRAKTLSLLDPEVFTQAMDGSATQDFISEADVAQVACPTLLFRADPAAGGVIADEDAAWFRTVLPSSLVMPMPGVGHGIHTENPVEFSAAVAAFLELL